VQCDFSYFLYNFCLWPDSEVVSESLETPNKKNLSFIRRHQYFFCAPKDLEDITNRPVGLDLIKGAALALAASENLNINKC
jgi:hypothetical protein